MLGLSNKEIQKINSDIRENTLILILFFIALVIIVYKSLKYSLDPLKLDLLCLSLNANRLAVIAIYLSSISFILSVSISFYSFIVKSQDILRDDKIKKKEKEIKRIEDSISLFYVPLQNLITVYEERELDEVKLKIINEINGHKYLAEPRIRSLFEIYLLKNEESKKISKKLLYLACRDLENLQKQLLNEQ